MTKTRTAAVLITITAGIFTGAFLLTTPAEGTTPTALDHSAPTTDQATTTDPDLDAATDWALDTFTAAGLELPSDLEISFDTTLAGCDDTIGGRYHRNAETPHIVMCATRITPMIRQTLLHELAHAWEHHTMSDADRHAFQTAKGLPTWRSHDHAWGDRAAEHVAEIVAWGLLDGPGRIIAVANDGCEAIATDYHTLTGHQPPAGLPDTCTDHHDTDHTDTDHTTTDHTDTDHTTTDHTDTDETTVSDSAIR